MTAPPKPKKPIRPLPPILDPSQEPEGQVAKPGDSLEKRRAAQGLRPGQMDAVTQGLMNRQKELSSRRAYLRNFWYAAGKRPPRQVIVCHLFLCQRGISMDNLPSLPNSK